MADHEKHPSSSPPSLDMQFGRQWQILRPRVYRFLEARYVDAFFNDGSLRLSSFAHFAKHPDEERKDKSEGASTKFGVGSQATFGVVGSTGQNFYVLCGTLHNTEAARKEFGQYDACIAIDNVTAFANAVSFHIPYFTGGLEGSAIYKDQRTINRNIGDTTSQEVMEKYRDADGNLSMDMVFDLARSLGGNEELFLKHSRYAKECEYRVLWGTRQKTEAFIDIKVPEARQFCRHVTTEN